MHTKKIIINIMKKPIKFKILSFDTITSEGLEHHRYEWKSECNQLIHYIDNTPVTVFNEVEARKLLKKLVGKEPKTKKEPKSKQKQDIVLTSDFNDINQLNIFE